MNEWSCAVSFQAANVLLPLFTLRKGSQDLLSYTTRRGAGATNLEKLLELLFVFFTALLRLFLVNEGGRSLRTVPPKPQIALA